MPVISVIIPVFKVEPYLRVCIESVLNQTFQDFELILVDDGSPDNCPAICEEYKKKDNRIIVIHKKNEGLSSARNCGLDYVARKSDSLYITFIDSDDYVDPKYLELLYCSLINNESDVSVCGLMRVVGDEVKSLDLLNYNQLRGNSIFTEENSNHYFSIVPAKLYSRKSIIEKRFVLGAIHEDDFFANEYYGEDIKICTISEQLYFYRFHNNSIMNSQRAFHYICAISVLLERLHLFRTRKFLNTKKDKLRYTIAILSSLERLHMCNDLNEYKKRYNHLLVKCFFVLPICKQTIKFRVRVFLGFYK